MSGYDNEMTFVLFPNDKGDNPKRPDYTGRVTINGVEMRASAWWKQGRKGDFLSGKLEPQRDGQRQDGQRQGGGGPAPRQAPGKFNDLDDDVPF